MTIWEGSKLAFVLGAFVLLPILHVTFFRWKFREPRARQRAITVYLVGLVVVIYGDVVVRAVMSKFMCDTRAGTHIYKTVTADGFLGDGDIEYWSKRGFKYVEVYADYRYRITMQGGKRRLEKVEHFSSEYEVEFLDNDIPLCCSERRLVVRNRATGEVLGEVITFGMRVGFWDAMLGFLPGARSYPSCPGGDKLPTVGAARYATSPRDLTGQVIHPANP
ncbi:MAG: hypothetical protein HY943_05280 [Gammaproteobacteria bacterium]|nr:hypothetical protein [Gammaproteobacteria bacterium]